MSRGGPAHVQTRGMIAAALGRIQQTNYVLPAIQREFVWKPEQIEKLFDSLMQGYPFGTFLFWKVDPSTSGKFKFYDFVLNYHQRDAVYAPATRNPLPNLAVTAGLDGQQRLLRRSTSACVVRWQLSNLTNGGPIPTPSRSEP